MTAHYLRDRAARVSRFDLGGSISDGDSQAIGHIGLVNADYALDRQSNASVDLIHMQPPLDAASDTIEVVGLAPLSQDARLQISVFADETRSELDAVKLQPHRQYIVYPHHRPPTPDQSCSRFSCAGFVLKAYEYAGIFLVAVDDSGFPRISLERLGQIYPDLRRLKQRTRQELGLSGDGPWPVLLPGHLFHSLKRDADALRNTPYIPSAGQECF